MTDLIPQPSAPTSSLDDLLLMLYIYSEMNFTSSRAPFMLSLLKLCHIFFVYVTAPLLWRQHISPFDSTRISFPVYLPGFGVFFFFTLYTSAFAGVGLYKCSNCILVMEFIYFSVFLKFCVGSCVVVYTHFDGVVAFLSNMCFFGRNFYLIC